MKNQEYKIKIVNLVSIYEWSCDTYFDSIKKFWAILRFEQILISKN